MKKIREYLQYGEIKHFAALNSVPEERMYEIARGRISPRDSEMPFVKDLINAAIPRIEQTQHLSI